MLACSVVLWSAASSRRFAAAADLSAARHRVRSAGVGIGGLDKKASGASRDAMCRDKSRRRTPKRHRFDGTD
jgi:hypothetical protein